MADASGRFEAQEYNGNPENPVAFTSPVMNRLISRSPFRQGIFWGMTLGFTAIVSAIFGAAVALVGPLPAPIGAIFQKTSLRAKTDILRERAWNSLLNQQLSRPVNILVMGIDRVPGARGGDEFFSGRSDTMLLVRFDPGDNTVKVLSIPRDSRVRIPARGYTKINDANVLGGPALAVRVVSKTLDGVAIDRYARITTDAFKELVDLVGGVEVYVPEKMYHRDRTQDLEIDLEEGWQNLNGDRAEQFARYRNKQTGDIGRVQRQQALLKALQRKLFSPSILPGLPGAVQSLQKYIDTNLSVEEMLAIANFSRNVKRENVRMVLLPGRFSASSEFDGRSYWILNYPKIRSLVEESFTGTTALAPAPTLDGLRIAVQNATNTDGVARRMRDYLVRQGYRSAYISDDSHEKLSETEIIVQKGDLPSAGALQNQLGIGRVESSSTGVLDSDITVRVGEDALRFLDDRS